MFTYDDGRAYTRRAIGPTAEHFNLDTLVPALHAVAGSYDFARIPGPLFWRIAQSHYEYNVAPGIGVAA